MALLIFVALIILLWSYHNSRSSNSSSEEDDHHHEEKPTKAMNTTVSDADQPKIIVIINAGEDKPSQLATPVASTCSCTTRKSINRHSRFPSLINCPCSCSCSSDQV
ncbi:hypothetical protein ACLB2K_058246 [Fragaria x ananassa]